MTATVALMASVNPAYIAAQAGHSPKMLLEVYAKHEHPSNTGSRQGTAARFPRDSHVRPVSGMTARPNAGSIPAGSTIQDGLRP